MLKGSKRGQISFEFSIIVLSILLMSTITITYFLTSSFDEGTRTLDKIDLGAKTAVSLVNSGYNGTNVDGTIVYAGMTWEKSGNNYQNITVYITNTTPVNVGIGDFIKNYTVNSQNIDTDKYDFNVSWTD
uniref:Class III signal peptide n=1 Tax=Methanococcus maripaludis (strain C6 / ATCC BAA-1332) TaxID=444158 RepID=A9A864_METM6